MNPLRIRTLTAGAALPELDDLARVASAIEFLTAARQAFEGAGYEVQTTRLAISARLGSDADARDRTLPHLVRLDRLATERGVIVSVGPVVADAGLARWADELVRATHSISFSSTIASERGMHAEAASNTAQTMLTLSRSLPQGMANFRFAAAANIPAGTPFFPVAWHQGGDSLAVGVESASVVEQAFAQAIDAPDAGNRLTAMLSDQLQPIEALAAKLAAQAKREYVGIDTSPAPGLDRSIGAAIEALTKAPFGAAGTLVACSVVTAAIKAVNVRTCGYSGLMLPVLEDPVLARRVTEGRCTLRDLLLYSSVCGTGLDVTPIPGDTPVEVIAGLLRDVGALSARLRKPLSARLFVVPGKRAGEIASFDNPWLTNCAVMKVE